MNLNVFRYYNKRRESFFPDFLRRLCASRRGSKGVTPVGLPSSCRHRRRGRSATILELLVVVIFIVGLVAAVCALFWMTMKSQREERALRDILEVERILYERTGGGMRKVELPVLVADPLLYTYRVPLSDLGSLGLSGLDFSGFTANPARLAGYLPPWKREFVQGPLLEQWGGPGSVPPRSFPYSLQLILRPRDLGSCMRVAQKLTGSPPYDSAEIPGQSTHHYAHNPRPGTLRGFGLGGANQVHVGTRYEVVCTQHTGYPAVMSVNFHKLEVTCPSCP